MKPKILYMVFATALAYGLFSGSTTLSIIPVVIGQIIAPPKSISQRSAIFKAWF